MRRDLQEPTDVSTTSPLPLVLNPNAVIERHTHGEWWVLRRGHCLFFLSSFSLCCLFQNQPRNEKLLNLHRTKAYIPHIPLRQAVFHTGNTSLLYLCELTTILI